MSRYFSITIRALKQQPNSPSIYIVVSTRYSLQSTLLFFQQCQLFFQDPDLLSPNSPLLLLLTPKQRHFFFQLYFITFQLHNLPPKMTECLYYVIHARCTQMQLVLLHIPCNLNTRQCQTSSLEFLL